MTQLNIKFDSFFLIRCCFAIDFWATKQDIIKGIAKDDLALIIRKRSNKMRLWHKIKNYLILFDKTLTANQELREILNGWAWLEDNFTLASPRVGWQMDAFRRS